MKTYRKHLNGTLKNDRFRRLYEEEKQLVEFSLKILETRKNKGLSQKDVSQK